MDISAEEFLSRYKDGSFVIIDVREEMEFHSFNVGGENIPLGTFLRETSDLEYPKDAEMVIVCQRGIRSETACRAAQSAGFQNVRNLSGGLLALQRYNHQSTKS